MIQRTPWTYEECKDRIRALRKRYEGGGNQSPKLHDLIRRRREHYYNMPEADPILPDIWSHAIEQTTLIADTHLDMKARLLENRWKPAIDPAKNTGAGETQAEEAEQCLVYVFTMLQTRTGIDLQSLIDDGMAIDGPVYLHWRVDGYGDVDEYAEELDELSSLTEGDRWKYTTKDYPSVAGRSKTKMYREREQAAEERILRAKAMSGGPVWCEVLGGDSVFVRQDKSQVSEFDEVLVVREVGVGALYEETDGFTAKDWWEAVSGDDAEREGPVENINGSRTMNLPSASDWGETVTLYQLWDRYWCYEIVEGACVTGGAEDGVLFRVLPHYYGMPPFSKAVGLPTKSNDPALAERPYLDSMFRRKPQLDRTISLRNALAESGAVPVYFLQEIATGKYGAPFMDELGAPLDLSEDSAKAGRIPPGHTIVKFGGEGVAGSYEKMVAQQFQEMLDARPPTGKADFGVSTKPFAALQQTRQENRVPKMLIERIQQCLTPMVNNVMKMLADAEHGPGPVAWFPIANGDQPNTAKVMTRNPEDWQGLVGGVDIQPVDSTEQIAQQNYGLELLVNPILGMSQEYFVENYMHEPNPQQLLAKWAVTKYVRDNIEPLILKKKGAEWMGPQLALMPDGGIVNGAGQQVPGPQVAQQLGAQPIMAQAAQAAQNQPPPQQVPAPVPPQQPTQPNQMAMPPMSGGLTAPPMPGIR